MLTVPNFNNAGKIRSLLGHDDYLVRAGTLSQGTGAGKLDKRFDSMCFIVWGYKFVKHFFDKRADSCLFPPFHEPVMYIGVHLLQQLGKHSDAHRPAGFLRLQIPKSGSTYTWMQPGHSRQHFFKTEFAVKVLSTRGSKQYDVWNMKLAAE